MSALHTAGPWSRDKYGHIVDVDGRDVRFRSLTILAPGSEEATAEAERNTDLAAAAPAMLQMLIEMKWREYNPFEPDNQSMRYVKLVKLIAEALGAES